MNTRQLFALFILLCSFLSTVVRAGFPVLHPDPSVSRDIAVKVLYAAFGAPHQADLPMIKLVVSTSTQHNFVSAKMVGIQEAGQGLAFKNFSRNFVQLLGIKLHDSNSEFLIQTALLNDILDFKKEEGGGYSVSLKGYKSKKPILLDIVIRSVSSAPKHYPAFGKSTEESYKIAQAVVDCVYGDYRHGYVSIEDWAGGQGGVSLKAFQGHLDFKVTYHGLQKRLGRINQAREVFASGRLVLVKTSYGSDNNRYVVFPSDAPDMKCTFSLVFTSSDPYDLWQRLLPVEPPEDLINTPDFQQRCATLYFRHFQCGSKLDARKGRACLVSPYWVAELEWCKRIERALKQRGYECLLYLSTLYDDRHQLYKSQDDEIYMDEEQALLDHIYTLIVGLYDPNFTFFSHHKFICPKGTPKPKIGCLSIYPEPAWDDHNVYKRLCDFDAVVHCNPDPAPLIDIFSKGGVSKPILEQYPSSCATDFIPRNVRCLFYCGLNWDGLRGSDRYATFFKLLEEKGILEVYGPTHKWKDYSKSYKGFIPVEQDAMQNTIAQCGVALCLHSDSHLRNGIPTARFFEAVAASAVVICDDHPFFRKHFKDACLLIDQSKSADEMAAQVMTHWAWIKAHPGESQSLARRAHDIFVRDFALERYVESLVKIAQ